MTCVVENPTWLQEDIHLFFVLSFKKKAKTPQSASTMSDLWLQLMVKFVTVVTNEYVKRQRVPV